jgi:hypothetical protein
MEQSGNRSDILKKIAELESLNDQLQAELRELDRLMKDVGFSEGIATLKQAAREILDEQREF